MRRFTPVQLGLAAAIVVILILAVLLVQARLANRGEAKTAEPKATGAGDEDRCASQDTYDRIKLELFRVAAQTRGGDRTMFDRLSAYSSVRVERPLMKGLDEELGTLRCSGRLSLDLPPGTAVVGGRRTLTADVDYVLQPAADGSGDVVLLEGADPIVIPLATVARSGEGAPTPSAPAPLPTQTVPESAQPPIQPPSDEVARSQPAPSATPQTGARPGFNCRYARTSGEIAVCRNDQLASLDRAMASQFYRALSAADRGQRRQLTVTRDRFLRYRDRCGSDACIADAYQGRMREIDDIMRR
jgi:hypothetical protein